MAFVTGYEDGSPMAPGLCDPLAGIHGAFAVLAALEERRGTGRRPARRSADDRPGRERLQFEQILEFDAYGELMTRRGNRCLQAAPQGVYACAGDREWLALSVTTEEQWKALCEVIGARSWLDAPELATVEQPSGGTRSDRRGDRSVVRESRARGRLPARSGLPELSRSSLPTPSTRTTRCRHVAFGNRSITPSWVNTGIPDGQCASRAPRGAGTDRRRRCSGSTTRRCSPTCSASHTDELADLQQAGVIGDRPLGL